MENKKEKKGFFTKRSKCLFFAALIAAAYAVYILVYFSGAVSEGDGTGFIATALVTPHMVLVVVGAIFLLIGFLAKKAWAALTGSIAMCVGAVLFLMYAAFCAPSIILGFIGYANQKKLNAKTNDADGQNQRKDYGV